MAFLERYELPLVPSVIQAGQCETLHFVAEELPGLDPGSSRIKLRLRGDVALHPSWMYEGGLPFYYRDIDDALTTQTHHSAYALKLCAQGEPWPRRMHYKLQCPPKINSQYPVPQGGGPWRFRCWVKTRELEVQGKAAITFACYQQRPDRNIRDINAPPDALVELPIPTGTADWQQLSCDVPLGENTAAILVCAGLEQASGTVYLEDLRLENGLGFNILPPIAPANRYLECFNWYGENLSHKEWTDLAVSVNGGEPVVHKLFQRCFRGSENEFTVTGIRQGENRISLTNVSDYREPLPWRLEKAELLVEKIAPVRIAWCPETVVKNRPFAILLKTYTPQVVVEILATEGLSAPERIILQEPGLHVLPVEAGEETGEQTVTVRAAGYTETARILRIVEKREDGILAGSGDAIYIPQETEQMADFLIWYLENGLGNMLTFRPVYRWSGTRTCNAAMWEKLVPILNGLGLSYCLMFDGRELPGLNANPTKAMLDGPGFLGVQAHERDGALYYWLQRKSWPNDILFEELSHRILSHPDFPDYHLPLIYNADETCFCFSPHMASQREAAEQFVGRAKRLLAGMKRHTGPSTLFKYLFQAGLEVGGAELMYGPTEVVLSALRGASAAYRRDTYTAHLAVQWGTTPHDTPQRYRRYQLALFLSYLHGVSHINTEEGLYRQEEFFAVLDRFSEPIRCHQQIAGEFTEYVRTHTRRGKLHRGIALLHGQYDGWACFCRREQWAQEGKQWAFAAPEESWDLVRVFYPDNVLDAIYRHPCPAEPQGYYSRTPYGIVDILPVEAEEAVMNTYRAMAFLGWNSADAAQLQRLTQYVQQGGTLVLGWPHLYTDIRREAVLSGEGHPIAAEALTGVRLQAFVSTENGPTLGRVELLEGTGILETVDGLPLLLCHRLGKGCVYFVNAREYPAEPAVRAVYEALLQKLGQEEVEREKERGFLESAETVQSCIYDAEDGIRRIYAVNTDWWSQADPEAKAVLCAGGQKYPVSIGRGKIHAFTLGNGMAAWVKDMDTEILSLEESGVLVQGLAGGEITVLGRGVYRLQEAGVTRILL